MINPSSIRVKGGTKSSFVFFPFLSHNINILVLPTDFILSEKIRLECASSTPAGLLRQG